VWGDNWHGAEPKATSDVSVASRLTKCIRAIHKRKGTLDGNFECKFRDSCLIKLACLVVLVYIFWSSISAWLLRHLTGFVAESVKSLAPYQDRSMVQNVTTGRPFDDNHPSWTDLRVVVDEARKLSEDSKEKDLRLAKLEQALSDKSQEDTRQASASTIEHARTRDRQAVADFIEKQKAQRLHDSKWRSTPSSAQGS
jgi:hypothetical protein